MGIPATGRQFTKTEIHIYRITNGKIGAHRGNVNSMSMIMQLGFLPS